MLFIAGLLLLLLLLLPIPYPHTALINALILRFLFPLKKKYIYIFQSYTLFLSLYCVYIRLSMIISVRYLSIYPFIYLSINFCKFVSMYLNIYIGTSIPIYLSIWVWSIYLSIWVWSIFLYLSIYLSFFIKYIIVLHFRTRIFCDLSLQQTSSSWHIYFTPPTIASYISSPFGRF